MPALTAAAAATTRASSALFIGQAFAIGARIRVGRLFPQDCDRDQRSAGRSPRPRSARRPAGAPLRHNGLASSATSPRSRSRRPAPARSSYGHEQAGFAGDHDFAAARNVGGDHRPAAGRGLQQAFRQSLAPRWQHRDVGARPERRDVLDMAEPGDAGLPAPAGGLLFAHRCRIGRIGRARDQQFDVRAALAQQPVGARSACECPCRRAAARRKQSSAAPGGSGMRLQAFDVDARAGDRSRCARARCRAKACCRGRRDFAPGPTCLGRLSSRRSSALRIGAQQQRLGVARGEGVAEPGQRVDACSPAAPPRQSSRGPWPATRHDARCPAQFRGECRRSARIVATVPKGDDAAAHERHRMQHEAFGADRGGAIGHPRRHMDLKAGVARRARHRQAMGQEIPVLGDDIEQAQRWLRAPISGVLGRAGCAADRGYARSRPAVRHRQRTAR